MCGDSRFYFKNGLKKLYNLINQSNFNLNIDIYPGALEKNDNSLTKHNNFKFMQKEFGNHINSVCQKGFYPYEWMDNTDNKLY